MKDFLSLDNGVMQLLGRVADCMILNLVFVACCLPVVTIGASVTAVYYVTLKLCDGEDGYILSRFFKSFKENFKQATIIWLILLVFGGFLALDFNILGRIAGPAGQILRVAVGIAAVVYAMGLVYVFPILSKFYNTIGNTLKNALFLAIGNLPVTLLMLVITGAAVAVTFMNTYTMWYGCLVWILLGFVLLAMLHSYFLKKIYPFGQTVLKRSSDEGAK